MPSINKVIEVEINDLCIIGEKIVNSATHSDRRIEGQELAELSAWVTRLGQLIRKLYGTKSQQFENYTMALKTGNFYIVHKAFNAHIIQLQGIAISIKHDYERGLLSDFKTLAQADVFADFLEMSEYLLKEGYKDAAAVIIGTVLEDILRKLCDKSEILTRNDKGKSLTIEPLNTALVKNDVYSRLVQKQVTTWADLRNSAAHGKFNQYDKKQVEMMLLFVQDFAENYLLKNN